MKNSNKSLLVYVAAYLAILVPSPGRFVYGFVIMFELFLLTLIGTLINSLINKLKMEEMRTVLLMLVLICFAIFYRQIVAFNYPEIALTLGFIFYLPPVSLFLVGYVFSDLDEKLGIRIKNNIVHILIFFVSGMLFFLFRDIAGYGTITFLGKNHQIYEKVLLNEDGVGIFSFFASIPGAMILSGLILFIHICIKNKFNIIKNAEVQKDVL